MLGQRSVDGWVAHGFNRGGHESAEHSYPSPLKRWATQTMIHRINIGRALVIPSPSTPLRTGSARDLALTLKNVGIRGKIPPSLRSVGMTGCCSPKVPKAILSHDFHDRRLHW